MMTMMKRGMILSIYMHLSSVLLVDIYTDLETKKASWCIAITRSITRPNPDGPVQSLVELLMTSVFEEVELGDLLLALLVLLDAGFTRSSST